MLLLPCCWQQGGTCCSATLEHTQSSTCSCAPAPPAPLTCLVLHVVLQTALGPPSAHPSPLCGRASLHIPGSFLSHSADAADSVKYLNDQMVWKKRIPAQVWLFADYCSTRLQPTQYNCLAVSVSTLSTLLKPTSFLKSNVVLVLVLARDCPDNPTVSTFVSPVMCLRHALLLLQCMVDQAR
jgi:hypothetical protein